MNISDYELSEPITSMFYLDGSPESFRRAAETLHDAFACRYGGEFGRSPREEFALVLLHAMQLKDLTTTWLELLGGDDR